MPSPSTPSRFGNLPILGLNKNNRTFPITLVPPRSASLIAEDSQAVRSQTFSSESNRYPKCCMRQLKRGYSMCERLTFSDNLSWLPLIVQYNVKLRGEVPGGRKYRCRVPKPKGAQIGSIQKPCPMPQPQRRGVLLTLEVRGF